MCTLCQGDAVCVAREMFAPRGPRTLSGLSHGPQSNRFHFCELATRLCAPIEGHSVGFARGQLLPFRVTSGIAGRTVN
jgi:hypothetical protein